MRGRSVLVVLVLLAFALYVRIRTASPSAAAPAAVKPRPAAVAATTAGATRLPSALHRPVLQPALRDPFAATPTVVGMATLPAAPPPPPPPPALPAAPAPPALDLSFAGRMVAPDGSTAVLVLSGEGSLLLRAGEVLSNGYRVESIDAQAVHLSYPPLGTQARLALPAPPRFETR